MQPEALICLKLLSQVIFNKNDLSPWIEKEEKNILFFFKHEWYAQKFKMTGTGMGEIKYLFQLVNEYLLC